MGFTHFPNGATSFGIPLPGGWGIGKGNVYFLDPDKGDDGYKGTTPEAAFKTLPVAYAALTANQHDTLIYIAGSSSLSLAAAVTWAKNYTHFLGYCAPSKRANRARIFQTASAEGLSPLIDVTATGCVFKDLYVFQGVDDATSLINWRVTGGRNYFENVHFAGGGHASQAIDGGASLYLSGAEENVFKNCTIGVTTIAAATGMAGLVVAATGGADRNEFEDCDFEMYAGNAGAIFVELLGNSGLDRYLRFRNCHFHNVASQAMTQAFKVAAGFDPANKRVELLGCTKIGAGKWDDSDSGIIYGDMNAVTGADLSGNLVEVIN